MSAVPFEQQLVNARGAIKDFADRNAGHVHVLVDASSPFAQAGITSIDKVPLHVEDGMRFVDLDGGQPDRVLGPRDLHLTKRCQFADFAGRCSEDEYWDGEADQ